MPTKIYLDSGVPKNQKKYRGKKSKLYKSINDVLHAYNSSTSVTGKGTAFSTRIFRAKTINQAIKYLYDVKGCKISSVQSIKQKHIDMLLVHWLSSLSATTIQSRCSALRFFCKWLKKHRLVVKPSNYGFDEVVYKRQTATSKDKTWSGQGIDFNEKILEVESKDPIVAAQMKLQEAFGLRARESWLFKPNIVQKAYSVAIEYGSKGGRDREIDIIEEHQLDVLAQIKIYANQTTGSLIPSKYSLKQWEKHYYYVCSCCGISRKHGIVPQGLRHEMANKLYELYAGMPSPVKAKTLGIDISNVDASCDSAARYGVAKNMGHSRKQSANPYCGTPRSVNTSDDDHHD